MARPEISEEVKQKVEDLTDEYFNVPSHRVTFEDRVKIMVEKVRTYEEQENQRF